MLSSATLLIHTIDSSLSRIDPTLFSDQAKMEIAFERTTNKSRFLDDTGNYALITEWNGVQISDDGSVTRIDINDGARMRGNVNFSFLPQTLQHLSMKHHRLEHSHISNSEILSV